MYTSPLWITVKNFKIKDQVICEKLQFLLWYIFAALHASLSSAGQSLFAHYCQYTIMHNKIWLLGRDSGYRFGVIDVIGGTNKCLYQMTTQTEQDLHIKHFVLTVRWLMEGRS